MNQGKLGVVKQELARVNVNILGISELKWTRMGEFHSDDHYIYYCGDRIAIIVNKSLKCSTWMQPQKWQNDLCFQGKSFNITVIQIYALTSNAEEDEVEQLYEDLQDLLELVPPKKYLKLLIFLPAILIPACASSSPAFLMMYSA